MRLGMLEGSDSEKFNAVTELFQRAAFTLDMKPNIIEWLWVHHAITREALNVVAARGVDLQHYPDARSVLNTPTWVAGLAFLYLIRFTEKGRRLLRGTHFDNSPQEMKRYYFDVLSTGENLGVAMPHLSALPKRSNVIRQTRVEDSLHRAPRTTD